jgi:uncharacterized membrane protein YvbJ
LTEAERETKACPYCGEEILDVAVKCKHCGSKLDPEDDGEPTKETLIKSAPSMGREC